MIQEVRRYKLQKYSSELFKTSVLRFLAPQFALSSFWDHQEMLQLGIIDFLVLFLSYIPTVT